MMESLSQLLWMERGNINSLTVHDVALLNALLPILPNSAWRNQPDHGVRFAIFTVFLVSWDVKGSPQRLLRDRLKGWWWVSRSAHCTPGLLMPSPPESFIGVKKKMLPLTFSLKTNKWKQSVEKLIDTNSPSMVAAQKSKPLFCSLG